MVLDVEEADVFAGLADCPSDLLGIGRSISEGCEVDDGDGSLNHNNFIARSSNTTTFTFDLTKQLIIQEELISMVRSKKSVRNKRNMRIGKSLEDSTSGIKQDLKLPIIIQTIDNYIKMKRGLLYFFT